MGWLTEQFSQIWLSQKPTQAIITHTTTLHVSTPTCIYMYKHYSMIAKKDDWMIVLCLIDNSSKQRLSGVDLRNASFLIIASGHHWEREMKRWKSKLLVNCICWLSPANQKANHKHWIVSRAYKVCVAWHCALQNAVSNDDLYIVCNAFWTAFLFL